MPSSYHIAEPHPTLPSTNYIYAGRGGAGNVSHINPEIITPGPDATGPASLTALPTSSIASPSTKPSTRKPQIKSSPYYPSGRGGAGNMQSFSNYSERPIFSFDEELERQSRMQEHMAPVYHFGRGGAGNMYGDSSAVLERRRSAGSSTGSSSSSGDSEMSETNVRGGILGDTWSRLRGNFAK